jgi:hypothetical protein
VLAGDDDDAPRQDGQKNVRVERDNDTDGDRPQDGERRRGSERRRDTDRPRDRDRVDDDQTLTDDAPSDDTGHTRHLGRTVKLEFTIIGEEEPSFIVLCAANDYLISETITEIDFDHALEIGGQVHPTDDPNRIFLTFEAMTSHADHNEGIEATHRAEGSASVKIDKETTLANLGADRLTVTATIEE